MLLNNTIRRYRISSGEKTPWFYRTSREVFVNFQHIVDIVYILDIVDALSTRRQSNSTRQPPFFPIALFLVADKIL